MSHTGSIIHPTGSPGIIRVITTGYVVNENKALEFRRPSMVPYDKDDKKRYKNPIELGLFKAQERFILFVSDNNNNFPKTKGEQYGLGVNFNIKKIEDFKQEKDKTLDEVKINELQARITSNVGIKNFEFKYIADDIEVLEPKFVLYEFYESHKQLSIEQFEDFFDTNRVLKVGNQNSSKKVKCHDDDFRIDAIGIRISEEFDYLYGPPEDKAEIQRNGKNNQIKVCANALEEIRIRGEQNISKEHKKSTKEELPTFV